MARYKTLRRSTSGTGYSELLPGNLYGQMPFGNVIFVDLIYGDDATGARNLNPFATLAAAVAAASAGDQIMLMPGTHTLSGPLTISTSSLRIRGLSAGAVSIDLAVTANTDMITVNATGFRIEDVTLNLTSTGHFALRGIVINNGFASTCRLRTIQVNINNSTAGAGGTSNCVGVYCVGPETVPEANTLIRAVTIAISSAGLGNKRALLIDTATSYAVRDCNFVCTNAGGAGSYIAIETNHASAVVLVRASYAKGDSADISRTLGTLTLDGKLENQNSNARSYSTTSVPNLVVFADPGSPSNNATRYMRPGSEAVSANEIQIRIPQICVAQQLSVVARTAATNDYVFTVRKNGVATALTATLVGATTSITNATNAVTFQTGDLISLQIVTLGGTQANDLVVSVALT